MALYAKLVIPTIVVVLAAIAYVALSRRLWEVIEVFTAALN